MEIPKIFISYSHDDLEHKKWVLELAYRLLNNGIDAFLDQFELKAGDDIPHFMETNLAKADKILMICTKKYVDKANKGEGGVGYEKMIITSTLMEHIDENKIVPIIKQTASTDVPTFLKSKKYINFSNIDDYEFCYDELVRTIHNTPLFKKPPIGNNPFKPIEKEKLIGDISFLHVILKEIDSEYTEFNNPFTQRLCKNLNISRSILDVGILKLIELGFVEWYIKNEQVNLTEKGKLYAYENNLFL